MTENHLQPVVLTIAGIDPSAGAGVLADIKTISAFGCYGVAAVTSITSQNTRKVSGSYHQSRLIVRDQLEPLLDDFEIAAVKTGMMPTAEIIQEVAEIIKVESIPHLVVDPVIRSTSGYDLIDEEAISALIKYLFPLASIVTPNAAEAERITGISLRDSNSIERAAQAMLALGARAALIKGGDLRTEAAADLLLDEGGAVVCASPRLSSRNTHGTGCALSSALACLLARGFSLRESLPIAKRYINEAIISAPGLGRGHGPLNHFPPGFCFE